ncbi:CDGSH iron-sulfur domain-containing protein [Pseudomonas sp. N040]|uniref:CDGSH iron-sulfur domain-containing protein n=1 Tax=Pseudomonas sp. N040 TaxID=2785325 RepID=UPI0018A27CE8|nr:CDGSH iron-sulfur domain-containing protein [Pseudomonas sp. N040]MBF7731188.1 CDGSH iron-sulfur domain-containing protein [Pseudomonas sp. N040]MBW7014831.1 CDGSH iron-sulfur domain-containing protein [Pseudomonas sp. N040]
MKRPLVPPAEVLPEVRQVQPGDVLRLCGCGYSAQLPDCPADCVGGLRLQVQRQQHLLLCRCGKSRRLPYCDGSHQPETPGFSSRFRRFFGLQ